MVSEWNIYEHSSHPAVVYKMIKLFLVLDLGTACHLILYVCVLIMGDSSCSHSVPFEGRYFYFFPANG